MCECDWEEHSSQHSLGTLRVVPWDTHTPSLPHLGCNRMKKASSRAQAEGNLSLAQTCQLWPVSRTLSCPLAHCPPPGWPVGTTSTLHHLCKAKSRKRAEPLLPQFLLECSARGAQGPVGCGHKGHTAQVLHSLTHAETEFLNTSAEHPLLLNGSGVGSALGLWCVHFRSSG